MPEPNDQEKEKQGEEKDQDDAGKDSSPATSSEAWEEKAKHYQSIMDKRDAENKDLRDELEKLKATQRETRQKELEEKEEYKKLYEEAKNELDAEKSAKAKLGLQVKLQDFLSEKYPDYAADFRWIAPHVTSEKDIASVAEQYVKAHPKETGKGTASLGNKGAGEEIPVISMEDLNDPRKTAELLEKDPKLLQKIEAGEINLV